MAEQTGARTHGFTLEAEDLAVFNKHVITTSPVFRRRKIAGTILPPLLWLGAWWLYVRSTDDPAVTAGKLWWLLLYMPIHFYLYPRRWLQKVATLDQRLKEDCKHSKLLGKRRVVLSEQGIHEHNSYAEIGVPWAKVRNVVRLKEHALVFLTAQAAIILPLRTFEQPSDYDEFVISIEERWKLARKS